MTFSILTYDEKTGVYAGAAATGSLCVGGWVLRGDVESGLCASQGTAPSTFWRDDALRRLYAGERATDVVAALTDADTGRAHRQLTVLDKTGGTAGFTGTASHPTPIGCTWRPFSQIATARRAPPTRPCLHQRRPSRAYSTINSRRIRIS